MARQYIRFLRFSPLLLLLPILWTAYSTHAFEAYLNSLSITLSDFPSSYAERLTKATNNNEGGNFDFDYSIFPSHPTRQDTHLNASIHKYNSNTNTIPSIIHFIWYHDLYNTTFSSSASLSDIPSHGSHAPARCILFNPNYTIWTWNATAALTFLTTHYPSILPTYNSYPYPIQRVDALKYHLLHHYGGVYMDLDIACRRPLEPLLEFPAWFPKASPLGVNNDLMASRPEHPLLGYMLERLKERAKRGWVGSEWVTVFWSTGPRFASDMVREWVDDHPGRRYRRGDEKDADADPDAFYILPEQFYSQDPGYTFFGHSPGGTWYGDDAKFVVWLLDRPWVIAIVIGTPVALYLALMLRKRRALAWKAAKVGG